MEYLMIKFCFGAHIRCKCFMKCSVLADWLLSCRSINNCEARENNVVTVLLSVRDVS
jgi:hypothetical protein